MPRRQITLPAFRRGETFLFDRGTRSGHGARISSPGLPIAADYRRQRPAYFSQIIYIVEWEGVVRDKFLATDVIIRCCHVSPEDEMTITQLKGAATVAVFRAGGHSGAGRGRRLNRRWGVGCQVCNPHPQPDESLRRQALARTALRTGVAARKVQQQSAIRNRCGRQRGHGT
jgi:hypothetical protein